MLKYSNFDYLDENNIDNLIALIFLSSYLSDNSYFIDKFHFNFEINRMKFNFQG